MCMHVLFIYPFGPPPPPTTPTTTTKNPPLHNNMLKKCSICSQNALKALIQLLLSLNTLLVMRNYLPALK